MARRAREFRKGHPHRRRDADWAPWLLLGLIVVSGLAFLVLVLLDAQGPLFPGR